MAKFTIRAWATQTLYDSADYVIEAETPEAAALKLETALVAASDTGNWIDINTGEPSTAMMRGHQEHHIVRALDPNDVIESKNGFEWLGDDGHVIAEVYQGEDT